MTDQQILDQIYVDLLAVKKTHGNNSGLKTDVNKMIDFIEQEWQRRDDQSLVDQYNRNRSREDWILDVSEMERHRGLQIGPDGTVTGLE